jgi:hypothetical protein
MERLVDLEAAAGDSDRGRERRSERHPTEAREGLLPEPRRPGHADTETARHALRERDWAPGRRVDEAVAPECLWSGLASVKGEDAAVARSIDRHEPATTNPAREGLDDTEHGGGRDRCIGGVASAAQHIDRCLRGDRVDARRRSTGADRGGLC